MTGIKLKLIVVGSLLASSITIAAPFKLAPVYIKNKSGDDNQGKYRLEYLKVDGSSFGALNKTLYKDLVLDKMCLSDPDMKSRMHSTSKIDFKSHSKQLLSFISSDDSYCGGPYPTTSDMYYTYDVRAAKKIDLLNEAQNQTSFKRFLARQFLIQRPISVPKDCADLYSQQNLQETYPMFYVKKGQLVVRQDYPHVSQACAYDIKLHCCGVDAYLRSSSSIARYCKSYC